MTTLCVTEGVEAFVEHRRTEHGDRRGRTIGHVVRVYEHTVVAEDAPGHEQNLWPGRHDAEAASLQPGDKVYAFRPHATRNGRDFGAIPTRAWRLFTTLDSARNYTLVVTGTRTETIVTSKLKRPSIAWAREVMANRSRDVKDSFARFTKDYRVAPEDEVQGRLVFFAQTLDALARCPEWAREKAWACVRDYVSRVPCEHDSGLACPRCGERSKKALQVSLVAEKHASIQQVISPMMARVQLVGCEHFSHYVTCGTCGIRWPGTMIVNVVPGIAPDHDDPASPHDPKSDDDKPLN